MDEVNLAKEGEEPRPTFFFAWDYKEMPGLDRGLVEHWIPLKPGKNPVKQTPRRFAPEVIQKIKAEIQRLFEAKFI